MAFRPFQRIDGNSQKEGRELNAPLTQGTAKRPSREARQAAPDGRVLSGWPLDLKFRGF
jgi:hypothetical protein